MISRRTFTAIALASAVAFAGAAQAQTTLRVANMGEPASLDPHFVSGVWENRIVGELFLGLTAEAADASIIPGAAEKWTISPDGKTYTFTIRDHKWSDGQPVTAGDFEFALKRILSPDTPAKYASLLYTIRNAEKYKKKESTDLGVRAIDAKTLEIQLENPAPFFLAQLTHYTAYPLPKHVVEKFGNDWIKPGNMVGNGPYVVTEWQANAQIKATKNKNFYDAANVKIDNVVWFPGEDRAAAARRFRANEIDWSTDFASDQIEQLRKDLPKETRIAPYLGIYYYVINTAKKPFDDKRVRQALAMAVDRSAITDQVLRTGELPGYSFVPPGVDNYGEPAYAQFKGMTQAERKARATQLMAQAGFTPQNPLKLTISYNTSENHKNIAIAVQSLWKDIGVQADIANAEVAVHYNNMTAGTFDVGRAGWIADYNDAQNFLYLMQSTTGAQNYAKYNSPAFDKLMDEAARTSDLKNRAAVLKQAEAIVMDDMPNIPIYYYVSKDLVSTKLAGYADNTKNIHRLRWMNLSN
jgi:oligopeptide transport system substrate-binding protein